MTAYGRFVVRTTIVLLAVVGAWTWLTHRPASQAQTGGTLVISMSHTPDAVYSGSAVVYTITVQNQGTGEQDAVTVQDDANGVGTIISASPSQGVCSAPVAAATEIACNLGVMPAGSAATIAVTKQATVPVGGEAQIRADVSAPVAAQQGGSGSFTDYTVIAGAALSAAIMIAIAVTGVGWYVSGRRLR